MLKVVRSQSGQIVAFGPNEDAYQPTVPSGFSVGVEDVNQSEIRMHFAKRLLPLEFLDMFTEAEQMVIVEASMQSAPIKLWYDKTLAASFVTISDPRVSAGLSALVAADLLTEQRMAEIVAAMSA